jgi:hypothetical protein
LSEISVPKTILFVGNSLERVMHFDP